MSFSFSWLVKVFGSSEVETLSGLTVALGSDGDLVVEEVCGGQLRGGEETLQGTDVMGSALHYLSRREKCQQGYQQANHGAVSGGPAASCSDCRVRAVTGVGTWGLSGENHVVTHILQHSSAATAVLQGTATNVPVLGKIQRGHVHQHQQ